MQAIYQSSRLWQHIAERPFSAAMKTPVVRNILRCVCNVQAVSAAHWLDQASSADAEPVHHLGCAGVFTSIINQADSLQDARRQLYLDPVSSFDSTESCSTAAPPTPGGASPLDSEVSSPSTAAAETAAAERSGVLLREQTLHVSPEFSVAGQTSVPVHQLVAVISSMLGLHRLLDQLPRDYRGHTMEMKWRLVQLLLLREAGDWKAAEASLEQLLALALKDGIRKVDKVMANTKIPEPNKTQAQLQLLRVFADCITAINDWATSTMCAPAFETLHPALLELAPAISKSVLIQSEDLALPKCSKTAGRLMEAAAVQAVRDALPEGWTLLTSLHLLGVDGQQLTTTQRGCKYEADMMVLDQQGVAVAIIEVKLAAANPLMALVNDVPGLLKLVELAAGRTLTCITKDGTTAAAAAANHAAAAPHAPHDGSCTGLQQKLGRELQQRLLSMTARAPFAAGPAWHVLHVPVHKDLLPVYVLGSDVSAASMHRGLNSLVSSCTLRLLAKSPEALVAALRLQQQEQQQLLKQQLQGASSSQVSSQADSSSSSSSSPSTHSGSSSCAQSSGNSNTGGSNFADYEEEVVSSSSSLAHEVHLQQPNTAGLDSLQSQQQQQQQQQQQAPSTHSPEPVQQQTCPISIASHRARIRAQLYLNSQQQQVVASTIFNKLSSLQERCRIYSLVKQVPQ